MIYIFQDPERSSASTSDAPLCCFCFKGRSTLQRSTSHIYIYAMLKQSCLSIMIHLLVANQCYRQSYTRRQQKKQCIPWVILVFQKWQVLIPAMPLHNHDIVSGYLGEFPCITICEILRRHLCKLTYIISQHRWVLINNNFCMSFQNCDNDLFATKFAISTIAMM